MSPNDVHTLLLSVNAALLSGLGVVIWYLLKSLERRVQELDAGMDRRFEQREQAAVQTQERLARLEAGVEHLNDWVERFDARLEGFRQARLP